MHLGPFLRRAATIGSTLGMLALAATPAVSLAAAPPPFHADAFISDSGFDKTTYSVGAFVGTNNTGDITFHNTGTIVHTATFVPGTSGFGVAIEDRVDAAGNHQTCWITGKFGPQGCQTISTFDTGGIDPGGSVTMGIHWYNPPASTNQFTLTSATDCLHGNKSSTFNCTPITVNVSFNPGPSTNLSSIYGSKMGPAGDPNCIPNTEIHPAIG
ncbi:MAG: hypothetical protein KGJ86_09705, partial [Chloroflexota bacterium]|nr:hypothetical protein [Chloroflexota bacterium]